MSGAAPRHRRRADGSLRGPRGSRAGLRRHGPREGPGWKRSSRLGTHALLLSVRNERAAGRPAGASRLPASRRRPADGPGNGRARARASGRFESARRTRARGTPRRGSRARGDDSLDFAGHPLRSERPFRVLAETPAGERSFEADLVLDASGVTGQPCWMGEGGLPARGERDLAGRIVRDLGSLDRRLARLAGRHVLLVGHGHSAATALLRLTEVCRENRTTRVTWAVRAANRRPCAEVAEDPLPERQRVASLANDLAQSPPAFPSRSSAGPSSSPSRRKRAASRSSSPEAGEASSTRSCR